MCPASEISASEPGDDAEHDLGDHEHHDQSERTGEVLPVRAGMRGMRIRC
jgi:hypothetical protein